MEDVEIMQLTARVRACMEKGGYSTGAIKQFNTTANQLSLFMDSEKIEEFNMTVGLEFLKKKYGLDLCAPLSHVNQARLLHIQLLSEYKMHGTLIARRHKRSYVFPEAFCKAAEGFLAERRFQGIIARNLMVTSLYLERFFSYLSKEQVVDISQISISYIDSFLRVLVGYSDQTKDHTLRAVRQFMSYCYRCGHHPHDLSGFVPQVHYEKRASIPSAYSQDDVLKMLAVMDRRSPVGKRNYAILLTIARLGLRSGDIVDLRFENIDWEQNKVSLTQHKTGRPITLPLLEDVGLAVIDYLKYGRPECQCDNVFVSHKLPVAAFTSSSAVYRIVAHLVGKAGLLGQGKKRGPHALRHSLASRLLEEDVPLPVISEILGHSSIEITTTYLSIDVERLRRCALEVQTW